METIYTEDIERELLSVDRFELSGVKYSPAARYESIDEMMARLFTRYDEEPKQESGRQERGDESHILCSITFDNGDWKDIESSKPVLLCNGSSTETVSADKLRVDDDVRIYANVNKEQLWHVVDGKCPNSE